MTTCESTPTPRISFATRFAALDELFREIPDGDPGSSLSANVSDTTPAEVSLVMQTLRDEGDFAWRGLVPYGGPRNTCQACQA